MRICVLHRSTVLKRQILSFSWYRNKDRRPKKPSRLNRVHAMSRKGGQTSDRIPNYSAITTTPKWFYLCNRLRYEHRCESKRDAWSRFTIAPVKHCDQPRSECATPLWYCYFESVYSTATWLYRWEVSTLPRQSSSRNLTSQNHPWKTRSIKPTHPTKSSDSADSALEIPCDSKSILNAKFNEKKIDIDCKTTSTYSGSKNWSPGWSSNLPCLGSEIIL